VWFRVNVGRRHNADPRWLLPMLCRRGAVVKADIGRIEIGDAETRVEVNPAKAKDFEEAACRKDPKEPNVRIAGAPVGGVGRPRRRGYSSRPR
jgi:ATP-dependent RNA helicase DeaD